MNINISGHGITITPGMRSMLEEKLSHLESHHKNITSIKVIVKKPDNHLSFSITIEIHASHSNFFAEASEDDFYKAIDSVKDKIIKQLDKHHDKMLDLSHQRHQHHHKDSDHHE